MLVGYFTLRGVAKPVSLELRSSTASIPAWSRGEVAGFHLVGGVEPGGLRHRCRHATGAKTGGVVVGDKVDNLAGDRSAPRASLTYNSPGIPLCIRID